jgi:hypothetical protein
MDFDSEGRRFESFRARQALPRHPSPCIATRRHGAEKSLHDSSLVQRHDAPLLAMICAPPAKSLTFRLSQG